MNNREKEMIQQLPPEYRPLGAWKYFGLSILFVIPVVGFIFLIIFSVNGNNINRRSYARSLWIPTILWIILSIVCAILAATGVLAAWTSGLQSLIQG